MSESITAYMRETGQVDVLSYSGICLEQGVCLKYSDVGISFVDSNYQSEPKQGDQFRLLQMLTSDISPMVASSLITTRVLQLSFVD
jgi:hypothetical protein